MYGISLGTINVLLRKNSQYTRPIWTRSGNYGNLWRYGHVTIQSDAEFQIVLEGIVFLKLVFGCRKTLSESNYFDLFSLKGVVGRSIEGSASLTFLNAFTDQRILSLFFVLLAMLPSMILRFKTAHALKKLHVTLSLTLVATTTRERATTLTGFEAELSTLTLRMLQALTSPRRQLTVISSTSNHQGLKDQVNLTVA